ncbi:hypothetical protein JZ751_022427, partial [Albula glossodonta]
GEEGPPSLEYIQAKDLFPQKELVKEEESLQGEGVEYLGRADDAIIAISNYRLHIKFKDSIINVPLRLIESVESRGMFQLHIVCKDSKVVRCHFSTFKQCEEWQKRLHRAIAHPSRLEDLFALAYHAWCLGGSADDEDQHNAWRVSDINSNYKLCSSYPQKLLVPVWITDKELESVASFRSWKRIPVVVYRHQRNGAVIARCSQPEISWWGWRNKEDEYLVTSIAKACLLDPGTRSVCRPHSSLTVCPGPDASSTLQKLLILDARSYTAAVANRAKGGGCENSFQSLRAVCSQIPDPGNWLSALESTRWLQHLSVMLKAATLVCSAVEREGRPVLVHCSDGWDRTPQIVALAKILLDPYYRTLEGFQVLVETEWLDYGHKFGDRCGHQENADDVSEQCPVFLQWLDCVHQLLKQFPCLFEFNEAFLVKLVQHTYSCLYGTFLCNNAREREARNIYKRTCSVWSLLRTGNKNFQNFLYIPSHDMVLQPVCHTRALQLWTAVYLPTSSPCTAAEDAMELYLSPSAQGEELTSRSLDRLPKTRSMDNLVSACENEVPLTRTSSDPNLNKHCQEGRPALEPVTGVGGGMADGPEEEGVTDEEAEPGTQAPPMSPPIVPEEAGPNRENCVGVALEEPCLTTQPLPTLHCTSEIQEGTGPTLAPCSAYTPNPNPTPNTPQVLPLENGHAYPHQAQPQPMLQGVEGDPRTADRTPSPGSDARVLAVCEAPLPGNRGVPLGPAAATATTTVELQTFKNLSQSPAAPPTDNSAKPPLLDQVVNGAGPEEGEEDEEPEEEVETAPGHLTMVPARTASARKLVSSQGQLSDFTLLGSNWDSVQGLMQSACGAIQQQGQGPQGPQNRRLANRLLRAQGVAPAGQCCRSRENSRLAGSWLSTAVRSSALCSSRQLTAPPPSSSSTPPPNGTAPSYLDDDGLPVAMDAVQQRLRQIEAGYKQEVEVLRRQVRQLQMKLESRQYCTPPSEPDVDYEDDITCLRESDDSEEDDSLSDHSDDRFSEGSWDRVERKDTEVSVPECLLQVTRWVPDHMASHCFHCDCEFWIAKRRHHCRNCGNVFCKDCCHLKLPIPDQQLYDPVLVCNCCHELLLESRTREIRSQQLKKPIATASS